MRALCKARFIWTVSGSTRYLLNTIVAYWLQMLDSVIIKNYLVDHAVTMWEGNEQTIVDTAGINHHKQNIVNL